MHSTDLAAFLHSPYWEEFLRANGQSVERSGDALYLQGTLPSGGSYWRSSRLPIDDSWSPPPFTKNAWFIRLEPLAELPASLSKFGRVRATDSVQPKQTLVVDLSRTEEEVLAGMKSKHRYNIRLAERHGVTVELFHEEAPQHYDRFWKLLTETATRHTFRTHKEEYYRHMVATLAPHGKAHLAFARIGDQDLAALLLITHEETATYLHGASTDARKEVMAPFLLHWQTMQWAKHHGFVSYDMWGTNAVQTEEGWAPRANHPSAGTTRFKLGFGGEVIQYPGAFDLVLKPIPYTLYYSIRRIIRRQSSF
ncbi:MAG TPA: peptidoglycan bridge formation glycyltransferase FemA/FemB family protein [Verrucomicrobiae bacterium]|nr:peptidoglycan bridge formation glycyltransferase FemA/FemB family protein [Verrucomicrobiae bacterium]